MVTVFVIILLIALSVSLSTAGTALSYGVALAAVSTDIHKHCHYSNKKALPSGSAVIVIPRVPNTLGVERRGKQMPTT